MAHEGGGIKPRGSFPLRCDDKFFSIVAIHAGQSQACSFATIQLDRKWAQS